MSDAEEERMQLGSRWLVHATAPLDLAPDVVGWVLTVSHVESDGRVWLQAPFRGQARCNTPEWWARFVSPVTNVEKDKFSKEGGG